MRTLGLMILAACAGVFYGCAATVPAELTSARQAYQHASAGPAAQLAPADLHNAHEALAQAEQSFTEDSNSYRTRDLAYVAQRKSEKADAVASSAMEQKNKAEADSNYEMTQGSMLQQSKQDLTQTRTELAASERSGQQSKQDLTQTRTELAASERSGQQAVNQISVEQAARLEAERRTTEALAALAQLAAAQEEERGLVITLSGSVLFLSEEAVLLPGARSRLDQVVDALLATHERNVVVEGHTDSRGSESYNLDLSQRRADSVRDYFMSRGFAAGLIQARGIGENRPLADNSTTEGRANNRRVEIVVEHDARR